MRRGWRAALPDRAEVSARGPRGLGPSPPLPAGRPPPRDPPALAGSGAARRPPARAWRGRGVAVGARPVYPRAKTRSACTVPAKKKIRFGILIGKRMRSGLRTPGMPGGRGQPARGLQTSSPTETCAGRATGSAGPLHTHPGPPNSA